jgi:hypothetical protein
MVQSSSPFSFRTRTIQSDISSVPCCRPTRRSTAQRIASSRADYGVTGGKPCLRLRLVRRAPPIRSRDGKARQKTGRRDTCQPKMTLPLIVTLLERTYRTPTEATYLTRSLRKTTNRRERIAFAPEHIRSGRTPAEPVPRKITGTKPNERSTPWTSPHRQDKQLQAQGRPWLSTPRTHHSPIRPESKAAYEIGYSRRSFCAAFFLPVLPPLSWSREKSRRRSFSRETIFGFEHERPLTRNILT